MTGRAAALALSALVAAVALAHLIVAVTAGGPVAVPDVPAYLSIAQWVGGDGLAPVELPYQPGYGLALAPLVAIGRGAGAGMDGDGVHHLALVVNALAAALAVYLAARLARLLSGSWPAAIAAGLIAALHPSLSGASRIAWPETLLGAAVLGTAVAVAHAARAPGSRRCWALAGLLSSVAIALHVRMVVGAVALAVLALLWRQRAAVGRGLLIGGAGAAAALTLTATWPTARLSDAAQFDRGLEPIVTVAGQLLALSGGTIGLGLAGLTAGLGLAVRSARKLSRSQPSATPSPLSATAIFVALSATGALVLGGWTLTGSTRADAALYGRYVDPWAVPLAIVAVCWLFNAVRAGPRQSARPRSQRVLAIAASVALVAFAIVAANASSYSAESRRIMTLSLGPIWSALGDRLALVGLAALGLSLGGIALIAVSLRMRREQSEAGAAAPVPVPAESPPADSPPAESLQPGRRQVPAATLALIAALCGLGAVAALANHSHLADIGEVARGQATAASAVAESRAEAAPEGVKCLAHDETSVPGYALWLYRLELPDIEHQRVQLDAGEQPCSPLVIAHDDLPQRCPNAARLQGEPAGDWALWRIEDGCTTPAPTPEQRVDLDVTQIPGGPREATVSALRDGLTAPLLPDPLVPPSEVMSGGVPPDGIPAIDSPIFERAAAVEFLQPQEAVVTLSLNGDARAYPVQIMIWHEIVNDTIGGEPVTVTYCPLCNTAIGYFRRLGQRVLDFGTSGLLYNSALVMYDRQTESLWTHYTGQAIAGALTGEQLELVPVATVSFETFRAEHPDGLVLQRPSEFGRSYGTNPYVGYDDPAGTPFLFSGETDPRLAPQARVLVARHRGDAVAVRLDELTDRGVVELELGAAPVVAFHLPGTATPIQDRQVALGRDVGATGVFSSAVDGERLRFTRISDANSTSGPAAFTDDQTGSTWSVLGRALEGPLAGTQLQPIEHVDTFWFAAAAFDPAIALHPTE